jgi:hypothetical protein
VLKFESSEHLTISLKDFMIKLNPNKIRSMLLKAKNKKLCNYRTFYSISLHSSLRLMTKT